MIPFNTIQNFDISIKANFTFSVKYSKHHRQINENIDQKSLLKLTAKSKCKHVTLLCNRKVVTLTHFDKDRRCE